MSIFSYRMTMLLLFVKFSFALEGTFFESHGANLSENENFHYLVIPGITGKGGEHIVDSKIINPFSEDHVKRISTPTEPWPFNFSSTADFGQKGCQEPLITAIKDHFKNYPKTKINIHASSQGTATTLNTLARLAEEDKGKNESDKIIPKIGAIILESAMISGNSAIYHTVTNTFRFGFIPYGKIIGALPYSRMLISNLSKSTFPNYSPNGLQTIDILSKIPTSIPIIIIHSKKDLILPYDGAIGIYKKLKDLGNENVYLLSSDRKLHIDLLINIVQKSEIGDPYLIINNEVDRNIYYINEIFKKHNLPYHPKILETKNPLLQNLSLKDVQPDFTMDHYEKYERLESQIRQIQPYINASLSNLIPLAMFFFAKIFYG